MSAIKGERGARGETVGGRSKASQLRGEIKTSLRALGPLRHVDTHPPKSAAVSTSKPPTGGGKDGTREGGSRVGGPYAFTL